MTIERVELLELPAGMRVLGMYALPGAEAGIGLGEDYDPSGRPELPGLTIPSGRAFDLVVGLELTQPGRFLIPATRVHCRVGEKRYRAALNHAVRLCGPLERYSSCPVEAEFRY